MQRVLRLTAAVVIPMVFAACGSAATTPPPTATPPPAATSSPAATTVPSAAAPTATPGPTEIPYDPNAAIPPGTTILKISAKNIAFSTDTLTAPANKPFVISFDNNDAGVAHNVAIRLGNTILFNPLPAVTGVAHVDYLVSGGLAAGSYKFFCIVHPEMQGDLTITP